MKKVKNKYIRLTEDELNKIIKESVNKLILEYAINRKRFFEKTCSLIGQILENWCLVRYCTITNTDVNMCKHHWQQELYNNLTSISKDKMKENNSYEARCKVINQAFENMEFLTADDILYQIKAKFVKENIDYKTQETKEAVENCSKSISDIVHLIANNVPEEIRNYINHI